MKLSELEDECQNLRDKVEELEGQLHDLIEVIKPLAIGSEQLWEVVFRDLIKAPVPDGVDVRTLVENL